MFSKFSNKIKFEHLNMEFPNKLRPKTKIPQQGEHAAGFSKYLLK